MTYPFVPSIGFFGTTRKITIQYISNSFTLFNGNSAFSSPNSRLNLYDVASLFVSPTAGKHLVAFEFIFDTNTIFNNSVQIGGEFRDITIQNYGVIAGRGGDGISVPQSLVTSGFKAGSSNLGGAGNHDGNPAIYINYDCDELTIKNESSGFIAGGGDGNSGNGDYEPDSVYTSNECIFATAQGTVVAGGGGGWNGGRGGYVRHFPGETSVVTGRDGGSSDGCQERSGQASHINRNGGGSSVVSSRSSSGSTGGSGGSGSTGGIIPSRGQWPNSGSVSLPSTSVSGGSGGSYLNGGGRGQGTAAVDVSYGSGGGSAIAIGGAAAGGGGGSGIGSGGSTYVAGAVSTNGAGGGYSVQVQSATLGSSSFTNSGRVYGVSNISVT